MHGYSFHLMTAASMVVVAFATLSAVDGIYIHLIRLKLHTRPESYREHLWHTGRAILFLPVLLTVFSVVSGGMLLWLGIGALVLDQALEVIDVASEKGSRESIGGLGSLEYVVHVLLTTLRAAAVALSLAARPIEAFSLSSPLLVGVFDSPWRNQVQQLVPGAVLVALLHVWLAIRHRPGRRSGTASPSWLPSTRCCVGC